MADVQPTLKDMETRMQAAIDALVREFATVRTGRASANLLDVIRVDYYGTPTPVNQMASVTIPDARTIAIQPWEAGQLGAIEKAIRAADLGLNPANDGKVVRIPINDGGLIVPGGRVESYDGIAVQSLVYGPDRVLGLIAKRLMDVVLATIALVLLSPLLLAIALWLCAVDGPPVLFRQVRVGLNGRQFQVVKFRTMIPDAEERLAEITSLNEIKGPAFKLTDDPRLTSTGRWLRSSSIDELPQLLNVVRGEMSLVGPRPPLPREVDAYDIWHRRRLSMQPGITGLWQVAARRDPDFDRWVRLDLDYIDHWSLWLDLKIVARTIPAMLAGEGR